MRWFTFSLLIACLVSTSKAHHPDWEHQRVWPRIDLIGPLGNNLPMEYRRRFNRPTYLGGWIAYHIEPTSQEAMAWHDASHQRAYADHRGRLEKHFFYPKPWEGLRIGPRVSVYGDDATAKDEAAAGRYLQKAMQAEQEGVTSASDDLPSASELIEQERFERQQANPPSDIQPPSIEPPRVEPPSIEPQSIELQPVDQ